ncbi:hypothetical protein E2562_023518 [Oryza meyeriana var. granulata]|uniref:Uncharacterized protein n=1 Tax=Oryza meyeriana var. granulata TaxID=110450 RepID=A0A6G1E0X6_9ORYZ|nr:hypothetical protein E2562_023518 [Oryza meyeriana var. granulata]KAF0918350.1 hypothetical protein E2562_023518 [Oryza meyeriana var. granulata]
MAVESWNSFRHKQMEARLTEDDKDYFDSLIEDRVASGEKIMPQLRNIKDSEYLKKVWGWERLLPYDGSVAWSHCINYLENYYYNCNAHEQVPGAAAATGAAELCFATEADLICESLRHGADLTDYLVDQSCEIRMCALSLMYCSPDHSVAAATAMVGITKETQTMHEWMIKRKRPLDGFNMPEELMYGHVIRYSTLDLMRSILEKSFFAPVGDGDATASAEAAKTTRYG